MIFSSLALFGGCLGADFSYWRCSSALHSPAAQPEAIRTACPCRQMCEDLRSDITMKGEPNGRWCQKYHIPVLAAAPRHLNQIICGPQMSYADRCDKNGLRIDSRSACMGNPIFVLSTSPTWHDFFSTHLNLRRNRKGLNSDHKPLSTSYMPMCCGGAGRWPQWPQRTFRNLGHNSTSSTLYPHKEPHRCNTNTHLHLKHTARSRSTSDGRRH